MEVEEYEQLNTKKSYKKGSLLNAPNMGFSGKSNFKKISTSSLAKIKPVKGSIDLGKARQLL